jgi:hypothetical protein
MANTASGGDSVVGGGYGNEAVGNFAAVGGGELNSAIGVRSAIGGGRGNSTSASATTVGGGLNNSAGGAESTVAGGYFNSSGGPGSAVGGGRFNAAAGVNSTVAGGFDNAAAGDYSFAAGRRAKAMHTGAFVWADGNDFDFSSVSPNTFRVRATNGMRVVTEIDGAGATTWSCLAVAGASWACASDRNLKQNLVALDGRAVLAKLASMPVYQWQPKGRNAHVRHYGPMAQDFHEAFGLGDDDRMIGMQDADGVALAAIQGLYAELLSREAALAAQGARIRDLEVRVAAAEALRDEVAALRSAFRVAAAGRLESGCCIAASSVE